METNRERIEKQMYIADKYGLDFADFMAYALSAVEALDIDRSEIADATLDILVREIDHAVDNVLKERKENE